MTSHLHAELESKCFFSDKMRNEGRTPSSIIERNTMSILKSILKIKNVLLSSQVKLLLIISNNEWNYGLVVE